MAESTSWKYVALPHCFHARDFADPEKPFGCRYFEFEDQGSFKINGKRLFLKGTQREEDHANLGVAMPEDLIRQEMALIMDMGANFIGLERYQQSCAVLDLCAE